MITMWWYLLFTFSSCWFVTTASDLPQNVLLILTDQERFHTHWPIGFVEQHLPNFARLQRHGLTFRRAYTGSTMCTPARATMLTGQYAEITGVSSTLNPMGPPSNDTLPPRTVLPNVMSSASPVGNPRAVAWKGKWHLSYAKDGMENWSEDDIEHLSSVYGANGWTPPDAGNTDIGTFLQNASLSLGTLGGGFAANDERCLTGRHGTTEGWGQSALTFLQQSAALNQTFFLAVSFVNPHDVWVPGPYRRAAGYDPSLYQNLTQITMPQNREDNLTTKPSVQKKWVDALNHSDPLNGTDEELDYVRFYAYLHTVVDAQIGRLLDTLDELGLTNDTVIVRTSDHGEAGLSHGGQREKAYSAYEEVIHIPLVVSSPKLFPDGPVETDAFYSHVDLMPTLLDLGGEVAPPISSGISQLPVILRQVESVRDKVLFAFDDAMMLPTQTEASHIRAIRMEQWMYAVYYNPPGSEGTSPLFEYELYDLSVDPLQVNNLMHRERVRERDGHLLKNLHKELTKMLREANALQEKMWRVWPETPPQE